MSNPNQIAEQLNNLVDARVETWGADIVSTQNGMYSRVLALVKELELTSTGQVKQTIANLKLLARIRKDLEKVVLTDAYKKKVGEVLGEHDAIAKLNNGYFETLATAFNPNKELYKATLEGAKMLTRDSLLEAGISANVIQPVQDILTRNVTTGGMFSDLVEELRQNIKGVPGERVGDLERYAGQIVNDALHQFNSTYNVTIGTDIGLDFVLYSGARKTTSRPFCVAAAGKYYHVKEFEQIGKEAKTGKVDVPGGKDNVSTSGFIKGTNASNIFIYRGGYNCGHSIHYTDIDGVPESVAKRALDAGYVSKKEFDNRIK